MSRWSWSVLDDLHLDMSNSKWSFIFTSSLHGGIKDQGFMERPGWHVRVRSSWHAYSIRNMIWLSSSTVVLKASQYDDRPGDPCEGQDTPANISWPRIWLDVMKCLVIALVHFIFGETLNIGSTVRLMVRVTVQFRLDATRSDLLLRWESARFRKAAPRNLCGIHQKWQIGYFERVFGIWL